MLAGRNVCAVDTLDANVSNIMPLPCNTDGRASSSRLGSHRNDVDCPSEYARITVRTNTALAEPLKNTTPRQYWPRNAALAQSESKARFLRRLGLNQNVAVHKQTYKQMKVSDLLSWKAALTMPVPRQRPQSRTGD